MVIRPRLDSRLGRKQRVLEEMEKEMARLVWLVGNEPGFTVVHGRSKLTFSWVKVRRLCHLPHATCACNSLSSSRDNPNPKLQEEKEEE